MNITGQMHMPQRLMVPEEYKLSKEGVEEGYSISTNTAESSDREAVRSQMRILSVISVKVFEKYGYNYLREIILRRADYQEYKISERDFKNLHPNDFEDLFLLNIQEKLNHLPKTDKISLHTAVNMWIRNLVIRNRVGDLQLGIESYQTKINLERPNWDAADYYFKEDYTIVPKPRAVVYRDRNDQRKLMRLNELHKFSDGTLTRDSGQEDDNENKLKTSSQHREKTTDQRNYRSLESFVGGRIRDMTTCQINQNNGDDNLRDNKRYLKDGDGDGNFPVPVAQDGDPSQDDVRLCLDDGSKKSRSQSRKAVR
ncbi:hypothetical protein Tco_0038923 [Tanacetum coccineum]